MTSELLAESLTDSAIWAGRISGRKEISSLTQGV